jgi:hypothetical protein
VRSLGKKPVIPGRKNIPKKRVEAKKKAAEINKPSNKRTLKAKARIKRLIRAKPEERLLVEPYRIQETGVEKIKYVYPEPVKVSRVMPGELPYRYGEDIIVLQVRDPEWMYCYWEILKDTLNSLRNRLQEAFKGAKQVLRVYDVSVLQAEGTGAHSYFDIEINPEADSWYIHTLPGRSWCVDFGLKLPSGEFITIVRSNTVQTPIAGPSWVVDEEWMVPEEMFARLYGMGFGFGKSSPVGKAWQERMGKVLFSGVLASPGMASMASPVKKGQKQRKFWLKVDCELIVYGATEPDALVTVQGKEIKLRPDGTFTMRYALPDGTQFIPVKAVSSDQVEERTIIPVVSRQTHG